MLIFAPSCGGNDVSWTLECTDNNEATMAKILVLHGPNLNMLGVREPSHYGKATLADINQSLVAIAAEAGAEAVCFQSNAEYALIERIHEAGQDGTEFIIINPAGFTHTSVALRDSILSVSLPFVEVHISNIHHREPFRHHSYFSDVAVGVICGLGSMGYEAAMRFALDRLSTPPAAGGS